MIYGFSLFILCFLFIHFFLRFFFVFSLILSYLLFIFRSLSFGFLVIFRFFLFVLFCQFVLSHFFTFILCNSSHPICFFYLLLSSSFFLFYYLSMVDVFSQSFVLSFSFLVSFFCVGLSRLLFRGISVFLLGKYIHFFLLGCSFSLICSFSICLFLFVSFSWVFLGRPDSSFPVKNKNWKNVPSVLEILNESWKIYGFKSLNYLLYNQKREYSL